MDPVAAHKPELDQSQERLQKDVAGQGVGRPQPPKMQLLQALRRQHPEYKANHKRWIQLRSIAEGGAKAEAVKADLLCNQDGRTKAVLKERAKVAPLVNKIGPIAARVVTQLFVDEPKVEGTNRPWLQKFLESGARLPDDPDRRAGFAKFLDRAMFNALVEGWAIAQVDTQTSSGARFMSGQAQSGELDPYVILLDRETLWDWEMGDNGLSMVKLHSFGLHRENWLDEPMPEHVFSIYERVGERVLASQYRVRRIKTRPGETIEPREFIHQSWKEEEVSIEPTRADGVPLVQVEVFNRSGDFEFPVKILALPGFLCVGEQILPLQSEHFNNRAGLNWAIQRANFAMPYIKGPKDVFKDIKVGDGFYLFIPEETAGETTIGDFSINSPAIGSSAQREEIISKDIYEILQQMAYLASQTPAAMARSEESRLKDKELEQVLLSRHGTVLKEFATQVLRCAAVAANDPVNLSSIRVDGFEKFQTTGMLSFLPVYQGLTQVGDPPIPAFKRQKFKDIIRLYGTTLDTQDDAIQAMLDAVDALSDEDVMTAGQAPAPGPGASGGEPAVAS